MEDLIIKPKRIYVLKQIGITFIFAIVFYHCYLIMPSYNYKRIGALIFSIFLAFVAILLFILKFILCKPILVAKTEGLYYQGIFIPWNNVNNFSLIPITQKSQMITINLNNYDEIINQFNPLKRRIVRLNKMQAGEVLPVSLFGTNLNSQEVLKQLKDYLEIARKTD